MFPAKDVYTSFAHAFEMPLDCCQIRNVAREELPDSCVMQRNILSFSAMTQGTLIGGELLYGTQNLITGVMHENTQAADAVIRTGKVVESKRPFIRICHHFINGNFALFPPIRVICFGALPRFAVLFLSGGSCGIEAILI